MQQGTVHTINVSGTKSIVRHGAHRASGLVMHANASSPDTQYRPDSGSQVGQDASPAEASSPSDALPEVAEPVSSSVPPSESSTKEVKAAARLALQYYSIQDLASCALEDAKETYRHVRSNFDKWSETPEYLKNVMSAGIMYNQAKNWQKPIGLQLSTAMVLACQRVTLHKDWANLDPLNLSPSKVLLAMSSREMQLKLSFRTGFWQGKCESLQYFSDMKQRSGYTPVVPVFIDILSLNRSRIQQIQEKRSRKEDCREEENSLALNFSEYWALNLILTMTDYSDPFQGLPFALPQDYSYDMSVWEQALDLAQLSSAQLQQCKSARQHLRTGEVKIEKNNKHLHQICKECFSMAYNETTVDAAVLSTLEFLKQNQLSQRMLITEAGFVFLFKILSPVQAALFYGYVQTQSKVPIAHFFDWMTHLYQFMCGKEYSKWMDRQYSF